MEELNTTYYEKEEGWWSWIEEVRACDAKAIEGMTSAERAAYYQRRGAEARAERERRELKQQTSEQQRRVDHAARSSTTFVYSTQAV